ncbi:hypothetical protein SDRG_15441 [Saprolegnia diclina VS20]|uniref:Uncharacterized protein n=1 Tax=Saprolegnia diclina (strain VS20) TaxID=1156394 RepID=T0PWS9_SAPDV|nr:hypothetical protein SDRG_15441 [Saprolegnia diclina VS20]EQC26711.1 hypothetical protein SDRG_15441 [Saprolegnia diclina VS20]|eukprot:XP_008619835.1 hypothetical protein SDRG_15441 [Saprolegnia diclina VS20]
MTTWDDVEAQVRARAEELPTWALAGVAAGTSAVLIFLFCILCKCCCGRKHKSQYEAISKDLEMEEKEFALGRTLDGDDDDELHHLEASTTIEDFNDDEMRQLEMLDAYRQKLANDTGVSSSAPLSPTAATTSHRPKPAKATANDD